MKRALIALIIAAATLAAALPLATASSKRTTTTTVSVSGKEFSFKLSRKSGPRGMFVFKFRNVGTVPHDFKIAGKKTPQIQPGGTATVRVRIGKAGQYRYVCTVPGHAAAGMKGVFTVK